MDSLRVFSTFSQKPRSSKGRKTMATPGKRTNRVRPPKKDFSRAEIMEKLQKSKGTKVDLSKTGKRWGDNFMKEQKIPMKSPIVKKEAPVVENKAETPEKIEKSTEASKVEGEEKVVKGDVGSNSPGDPMTGEKLKGLLSTGGFAFSDKERDVLGKILGTN